MDSQANEERRDLKARYTAVQKLNELIRKKTIQ